MHSTMGFFKFFGCTIAVLLIFSQNSVSQQIICGPAVYDVLDGICLNGFQRMILPTKKRSELPSLGLDVVDESENEISPIPFVANSIYTSNIYGGLVNAMAKTRRRRHGIYDECCRKGCTFSELASYCS